MKSRLFLSIILLAIAALSSFAYVRAIGISPDSVLIKFEPFYEQDISFRTQSANDIDVNIDGILSQYATLKMNNINLDGTFIISIKLPEYIDTPGDNVLFVSLVEKKASTGTVTAMASIRSPIVIRVPYPGSYSEISFSTPDLNIHESKNFIVSINNKGREKISAAKASIDVISSSGEVIERLLTETIEVPGGTKQELYALFNASKHTAGAFKAVAHTTYDTESKDFESSFKIGSLGIKLVNYTKYFAENTISKFEIEVESMWNSRITNVYGEIRISNSTTELPVIKTPLSQIEPWQKIRLSAYWDNAGIALGTYKADMTVYYEGTSEKFTGQVTVGQQKKPSVQSPGIITSSNAMLGIGILLIIILLIVRIMKTHFIPIVVKKALAQISKKKIMPRQNVKRKR